MGLIANLEAMLATGRDDALLRFSLGTALLAAHRAKESLEHLERAVAHNPGYSAAWKALGKARVAAGNQDEAMKAFRLGISAAQDNGDKQAMKEMQVFLRGLEKDIGKYAG